jgi:DNA ligase 1
MNDPEKLKEAQLDGNARIKKEVERAGKVGSPGGVGAEDDDIKQTAESTRKLHLQGMLDEEASSEQEGDEGEEALMSDDDEDKSGAAAKAREKVQSTLKGSGKDPYPDWRKGEPVPYAALCTTFSKIEMTTKRLEILAHCSLFLRQVLRLTPEDLLPTILLMINKLAADYVGIELGIGESLIMKAIGESTGRNLKDVKADQNEIGDLGLVAAKSKSKQQRLSFGFNAKPLTVRGVHQSLKDIATVEGQGAQGRKVGAINKLLSAADVKVAAQGNKNVDITKDKGGPSEAKFIVRTLEGKLRLGLAERTVLVALAQAMVFHEFERENTVPSTEKLAEGEKMLKKIYR